MSTLSSDVLEAQFGPTELQVISQDDTRRFIATRATKTGQILELSRVIFRADAAAFGAVHKDIMNGASMGKAFRAHGLPFRREVHSTYAADVPALRQRFATDGQATVIVLTVVGGEDAAPYADILEIYSPAVAWPAARQQPDQDTVQRLAAFTSELSELAVNS
jgi:hypothetical protein